MTDLAAAPLGYRGTKAEILLALKKSQPLTAKELAARFGVSANALRRHLKELEAEGMVRYRREVRGVGGPAFAYSLTENGDALFPRAYGWALAEVLDMLRRQHGEDQVVQLFCAQWERLARSAKAELADLPVEQRARRLAELLTSLGYMAEVKAGEGALPRLTEHNCAIRLVAERFPEVCAAEERFIAEVLGTAVSRATHIARGANCCEYCIQESAGTETAAVAGEATDRASWKLAPGVRRGNAK
jgi:DeoR family suf operon transcriptional repressor